MNKEELYQKIISFKDKILQEMSNTLEEEHTNVASKANSITNYHHILYVIHEIGKMEKLHFEEKKARAIEMLKEFEFCKTKEEVINHIKNTYNI